MAESKAGTTRTAEPKAPGPSVVEALANSLAAGFTAAALEEAEAALRAQYVHPNGDGEERALTPMQRKALDSLRCLGAQLLTATTVPATHGTASAS